MSDVAARPVILTIELDDLGNYRASGIGSAAIEGLTLIWLEKPTNRVRVAGPLQNKPAMYFLLEEARLAVQRWHEQQAAQQRIVAPPPGWVPPPGGNGR